MVCFDVSVHSPDETNAWDVSDSDTEIAISMDRTENVEKKTVI